MTLLLETERLRVRRFEPRDVEDIVAFTRDASVSRETCNIPSARPDELPAYIEEQRRLTLFAAKRCVDLAIARKEDDRVIGLLSLVSNGALQGEIGWALGVEHRGRGYATEAARALMDYVFDTLGYHRVFAGTVYTNVRSWKLMERLGMRKEAHFRKAHVPANPGGEWIDTVRYAVLAEDWPTERSRNRPRPGSPTTPPAA